MHFESSYDSDDDWFYESIQRYDDFFKFEFQGKVSSACLCKEDKFVATCLNSNGRNEVLELAVPDRLLACENVGLVKNRDFKIVTAGYLKSNASHVIAHKNILVTSETGGVNVYNTPEPEDSDLITHEVCAREISSPEICLLDQTEAEVFSGTNLRNVKSHLVSKGKELRNLSNIPFHVDSHTVNIEGSETLSHLDVHEYDLHLGLQNIGLLFILDLKSNSYQTINLSSSSSKWTYNSSITGEKIAVLNAEGEIFIFDGRNLSKELFKTQVDFNFLEDNASHLNVQIDPSEKFISVSGFDKLVKIFCVQGGAPIFTHDGHAKTAHYVGGHLWHDSLVNVIFSFDDTGILNSFKFKGEQHES